MKNLGLSAISLLTVLMTGCSSMNNGKPTSQESTIKKWETVDNVAFAAARPNWQYDVVKVVNSEGHIYFDQGVDALSNPFAEMYVRVPKGNYKVTAVCYLDHQGNKVRRQAQTHDMVLNGNTQVRFDVNVSSGYCKSSPRTIRYN